MQHTPPSDPELCANFQDIEVNQSGETSQLVLLINQLQRHHSFLKGNAVSFLRHMLPVAAKFFGADRIGVWHLSEDKKFFLPVWNYDARTSRYYKSYTLDISQMPIYANYLLCHQGIVAPDVHNHPALVEVIDKYVIPLQLKSVLTSALLEGNKIIGVIYMSYVTRARNWSHREQGTFSALGSLYVQTLSLNKMRKMREKIKDLEVKNNELNVTLQQVMDLQYRGQRILEENLSFNIIQKITPLIDDLQEKYKITAHDLEMIQVYLKSITSPIYRTGHKVMNLSQQEQRVVDMIRAGHETKEIARILGLSQMTVQTHKKNIRRKLRIQGKKINLQTYLDQIGSQSPQ